MIMPDIWAMASILAKLALYVGIFGSMGLVMVSAAFADLLSGLRNRMRAQTVWLAVLALLAAVLSFVLRGAALTGSADGMTDPEMLELLWTTPVGGALVYRLLGLAMLTVGLFIPLVGQWIALAGGTLALWSFAQVGHVPEVEQTGVRLLLLLHLLGISFWIGVLGPLRHLSCQGALIEKAASLGHRFGKVAMLIVPALIMVGVVMAWLVLGELSALVTTGYGQTLLIKLTLVGLVLGLAAANKLRFIPAMQARDCRAAQHLTRSIEIETLVILGALAATATLTSVLPLPN